MQTGHLSKRRRNDHEQDRDLVVTKRIISHFLLHRITSDLSCRIRRFARSLKYRNTGSMTLAPDDRVIDIGANVGAFCIRASRYSPHVVAVEPVTAELLRENIRLNDVPVQVIEGALGDGRSKKVSWDDREVTSPTFPLRRIIEIAGGCDFLKCDCEGAEWQMEPEDLAGVRRIEMELHIPPIGGPPNPLLLDYIDRNYHFYLERKPVHSALGVMGVLHAERK